MPSSIPEEAVRKYLELRWPNWKIARELETSPTTVQRVRTKIQTGPNPVLLDEPAAGESDDETGPARGWPNPAVLLAVALTAAAVIAAGVIWARVLSPPAAPAPTPQYTLCVQISPGGAVSGLASGSDGTCPPRWTAVVLTPGH
jgi:hypothetical protein